MLKKTTQLKQMLHSTQVEFLMGAHDGLSAKIAEEARFAGIWASGLCISAAMGIRDSNEASWTQVLEVTEFMSDATTIPILLDADTGYGNFNNVRRLVRKLEQRNVAGVCIEDKLFPKSNSFVKGTKQPLADIDEFAGKIRAAKDTQIDEDFCVVARTEGFISGQGLGAVLERADAYHQAGADAILVHSKLSTADQVLSFMREWQNRCPIVVVPTTYANTPTKVFAENGISVVIWANHLLRSIITTMQQVATRLYSDQSTVAIEEEVASVQEVFRLQNMAELDAAERRYLPVHTNGQKPVPFMPNRAEYVNVAAD
jgi:phosphoenolpyruvate phosphomutase